MNIARQLGLGENELGIVHRGGLLHDVGKIGVPSEILNRAGRLTPEEEKVMRNHVHIGARILEPISAYVREIPIVLYHHERYDGSGYPEGLAGDRIPLHARILAVADVFDALRSDRPYRRGWEMDQVIEYICNGSGTRFDPAVVTALLEVIQRGEADEQGAEIRSVLRTR